MQKHDLCPLLYILVAYSLQVHATVHESYTCLELAHKYTASIYLYYTLVIVVTMVLTVPVFVFPEARAVQVDIKVTLLVTVAWQRSMLTLYTL